MDKQIDIQTIRQIDKKTVRQTDRQTNIQIDRQLHMDSNYEASILIIINLTAPCVDYVALTEKWRRLIGRGPSQTGERFHCDGQFKVRQFSPEHFDTKFQNDVIVHCLILKLFIYIWLKKDGFDFIRCNNTYLFTCLFYRCNPTKIQFKISQSSFISKIHFSSHSKIPLKDEIYEIHYNTTYTASNN